MSAKRWSKAGEFDRDVVRDPVLRVLLRVMFDQENRLRVLEGRAAISEAQARTALKQMFERT